MNQQDFQLLDVLSETRNITRAAGRLFTTQSSVSKRIRQLEHELGTTLILRSRQGVHFTAEGEIVLAYARRFLRSVTDMRQDITKSRGVIAGTLRAGVSINYSIYRLPPRLAAYHAAYPLVNTQVRAATSRRLFEALLQSEIDVGILRGEYQWRGERILLGQERICAIVGEAHAGRALAELPQILLQGTDMDGEIVQWMHENRIPRHRDCIIVNNTYHCVELVKQGLGWGVAPEICLRGFPGDIRPIVLASGRPFLRSTYLMYTRQAARLPQVHAFIELIKNFREEPNHG